MAKKIIKRTKDGETLYFGTHTDAVLSEVRVGKESLTATLSAIITSLTNYYTKNETYSQAEVDQLVSAIKQFNVVVASSLPTASANTMNTIYLIPSSHSEQGNVKDEFITIQDGGIYKWEQIGTTAIDLSDYSTTAEMNAAIASALSAYSTTGAMNAAIAAAVESEEDRAKASVGYYECDTAAGTAAKVVAASGYILATGGNVRVKMTNANTADNVTLNINSTGAKALYYDGEQVSSTNSWENGDVMTIYYDGEKYVSDLSKGYDDDTELSIASIFIKQHEDHLDNVNSIENINNLLDTKMGEDEELVLANALVYLKQNGGGGNSGVSGSVTISNSDYITILGASYSDGCTPLQGKDWTSIVSALTDYNYLDLAKAGTNPYWWLSKRVRTGMCKGSHALITGYCINQLSSEDAVEVIHTMCDTLESLGIEPILGSSYIERSDWLKILAKDRGYYYFPCSEYYELTYKGRNPSGNDNYHLGTYSIGAWSNGYMVQAPYIDRPRQSLKLFRLRSGSASKTLDELVFHTNEERFENFRELYFGQLRGGNEYESLSNVVFADKALVSVVLPVVQEDLSNVTLKLLTQSSLTVYVLNSMATPYPSPTTYARFSVPDEISSVPTAGDVYSTNGVNYTVVSVVMGENGMYCTIYCSPTVSETGGSGTLTKVNGEGPSTLIYNLIEEASLDYDSDNGGHWVEVSGSNGSYSLGNLSGIVHLDKLHFLIVGSSFSLSNIEVEYSGSRFKPAKRGRIVEFESNDYNNGNELLDDASFGVVGTTLTAWYDSNGDNVVTRQGYVNYYIGSSIVLLTDELTMEQTIENLPVGQYVLEVVARNPQETVTEETYDFSDLYVTLRIPDVAMRSNDWNIKKKVGLYPTILRYPISISNEKDVFIKLYATSKGVEILKTSLKRV